MQGVCISVLSLTSIVTITMTSFTAYIHVGKTQDIGWSWVTKSTCFIFEQ